MTTPKTDLDMLDNWFTYHPPTPNQQALYVAIREKSKELARYVIENTLPSADRTAAIRSLRRTVMDINLAIACNPEPGQ